ARLAADAAPGAGLAVVGAGAARPCGGVAVAAAAGVPTLVARLRDPPRRGGWDAALAAQVAALQPALVISAGFLKLVGDAFLAAFGGRYLNTHNTLLPAFPGIHGPRDALEYGVKITGATLFVVDADADTGAID